MAAAVFVARKEKWRRTALWNRVREFHALTKIPITSPIISLIVGSEEKALQASRLLYLLLCWVLLPGISIPNFLQIWNRYLLKSGFHITAIRPPTVPPNSCRSVINTLLIILGDQHSFFLLCSCLSA